MAQDKILDISWGTIIRIIVALLGFYALYLIKDILIWVAFGLIISILFNPAIDWLERRKIPRIFGTIIVYFILFGMIGGLIYAIAPVFAFEIQKFSQNFPQYFEELTPILEGLKIEAIKDIRGFINLSADAFQKTAANVFNALSIVFGGILSTIFILTIAFFFSLEGKTGERILILITPEKYQKHAASLWKKIRFKVSAWFGTRVLCAIFVALTSYLALYLFKIDYALTLGIFAGVLDIIPIIGPLFAGAVIVLLALLDSWTKAFFVLIVLILINQIEGNILTPILSKKFIGLPPVLVLISLMIGAKLFGFLGAVLAVPLGGIIYEFLKEILEKREESLPKKE